jgi:hypothetical protein
MKASDISQPSVKTTIQKLQQDGYKVIGRGAAAIVLAKEQGDVIKIGSTHDGWLTYAKACEGMNNPYLPHIKTLSIHDGYYVAEVERLKDIPESFHSTKLYKQIVAWLAIVCKWVNGRDTYLSRYTPDQIKKLAKGLVSEHPDLVAALKLIGMNKGTHKFDVHPDNIMKRSDGHLVLSDPLATL